MTLTEKYFYRPEGKKNRHTQQSNRIVTLTEFFVVNVGVLSRVGTWLSLHVASNFMSFAASLLCC